MNRVYYGVTAIARFEGRRCVLSFEDPDKNFLVIMKDGTIYKNTLPK